MKKLLTILLLASALVSKAQLTIPSAYTIILIGSGGITPITAAVDTSYEAIVFNQITDIDYDALRPNKIISVSSPLFLSLNNVPIGGTGHVRFVKATGSEPITVNGELNTTIPMTPGAFTLTYTNTTGILNWN